MHSPIGFTAWPKNFYELDYPFQAQDLAKWTPLPADWKGGTVTGGEAALTADTWSFLVAPVEFESVRCEATVTIHQPATQFGFFGSSWSVWPDRSVPDGGFEVAIVLHASKDSGYRVQWSHKYRSRIDNNQQRQRPHRCGHKS